MGGMKNFAGGNFFIQLWESDRKWFWPFDSFSKLKRTFCNYRTSIKIKTSMTCVYKEYKVKIKIMKEQWLQLKMKFLMDYNMKIVNLMLFIFILVERGLPPPIPPVGKNLIRLLISFQKSSKCCQKKHFSQQISSKKDTAFQQIIAYCY